MERLLVEREPMTEGRQCVFALSTWIRAVHVRRERKKERKNA